MTPKQADAIFTALVEHLGIKDDPYDRALFVHSQTGQFCPEQRLSSALGFGGKFRRNSVMPGTPEHAAGVDEYWYVDYYPEDKTKWRDALKDEVNVALRKINLGQ